MAEKCKTRRSGKSCAAGGPGKVSCTNTHATPGVSIHKFPSGEAVRKQWVKFVHKHRPDFKPTQNSFLCSVHFTPDCFTRRIDLIPSEPHVYRNRHMRSGSVPTIDVAIERLAEQQTTERERRMIMKGALRRSASSPALGEHEADAEAFDQTPEPRAASPPVVDLPEENIVMETPVGAAEPPTPSSCTKCSRLAKSVRRYQKDNCYLRKRNRELKEQIKCARANDSTGNNSAAESSEDEEDNITTYEEPVRPCSSETERSSDESADEQDDPNWASEDVDDSGSGSDNEKESKVRVEKDTPVENEPKFLVFYSMLLGIFSLFCFRCKTENPKVEMKQCGTMVTVLQHCKHCEGKPYTWRSQPYHPVLGRYPVGNLLLSFAVLLAGASISKVLLVFRHMGLSAYCVRTYFVHQKKFIFPAILQHWETYREALIQQLKTTKDVVWCGDGRFDSMGHCAKYGAYSMFCSTIMKIVHFELLQANETGSSGAMELEGAKRSFHFLQSVGLSIATFISDRHRGIAKWIRQFQPQTYHFYDVWHVARSINKKLLKASKENGCSILKDWMKGVRNHLYWCVTSTMQGFENLILAKWRSFMHHVTNKHSNHPDTLFPECAHGDITKRHWIKIGTIAYDKLVSILTNTQILNDIKRLSPDTQTSCLEGFHATLNHWHPKMIHFSWLGSFCRHAIASLHFNENVKREVQTSKDGKPYYKVSYPKFKNGEVLREVAIPQTYGYVDDIRKLLFTLQLKDFSDMGKKYKQKVPEPMNRQFPERKSKEEAIKVKQGRRKMVAELFPPVAEQSSIQDSIRNTPAAEGEPLAKKKAPCCRKCNQPMRGHPRNQCPVPSTSWDNINN